MNKLKQEELEQLYCDLKNIIDSFKGNDVAVFDNNLKATIKNIKELTDGLETVKKQFDDLKEEVAQLTAEIKKIKE